MRLVGHEEKFVEGVDYVAAALRELRARSRDPQGYRGPATNGNEAG